MIDGRNIHTELVLTALGQRRSVQSRLLFHSDQGSQYASGDYPTAFEQANISCNMSSQWICWDNAVAESYFGILKTELIHPIIFSNRTVARTAIAKWMEVLYSRPRIFSNRTVARTAITKWMEVLYSRQRLHSTIRYLSPVQFE